MSSPLELAQSRLSAWRADPVRFVREVFEAEPDEWQADALRIAARPGIKRISMQACVGPGKSAVLAWLGWYFLACFARPGMHPKGAAVAITRENLKDNLWAELSTWQNRSPFLKAAFTWTSERIFANDHPTDWFLSARSWPKRANPEEQGRTLSGLHAKFVLVLLDESSEIPLSVLKAGEQAMTDVEWGCIAQAGNPTSQDGMLYAAATTLRDEWEVIPITGDPEDPKRSPRVGIEWAQKWIDKYGRDDAWVKSHILGEFPPAGFNSLLSVEDVQDAMKRKPADGAYEWAPRILGVDVAREGLDASVIFPRQGKAAFPPKIMRGLNSIEGAGAVAAFARDWGASAVFVDDTGGYGGGWIDRLRELGHEPTGVQFAGRPTDPRYFNKRSEMHFRLAEWVKEGGSLPNEPELVAELTEPRYTFKGDRLALEDKDQIKAKLGRSPDRADGLALTFAFDVAAPDVLLDPISRRLAGQPAHGGQMAAVDRDPLRHMLDG